MDPTEEGEERSHLDAAMDVFLYAPVGLAFEARSLVPRLARRGREQINMAREVGRFAVRKGRNDVEGVLRGLGVVGEEDSDDEPATPGPQRPAPAPVVRSVPDIDPETLAIPGYDTLSASQVVPRLASLQADELELIGRYETAGRGRKTILAKIAQLQSGD